LIVVANPSFNPNPGLEDSDYFASATNKGLRDLD
jgi:hypothetical protein